MNNNKDVLARQLIAVLLVSVLLLVFSACSIVAHSVPSTMVGPPQGPNYTPGATTSSDTATVYIYRQGGDWGSTYIVSANRIPLAPLPVGGYFVFHAVPGQVEFSATLPFVARTSVTVDANAGEIYYIRATMGVSFSLLESPHLTLVSNDVGAKEILASKLVLQSTSTTARSRLMLFEKAATPNDEGAVTTYRVRWFSGFNMNETEFWDASEYVVDGVLKLTDRSMTLLLGSDMAAQTGTGLNVPYSEIASIELGHSGLLGLNQAVVIKRRDGHVDSFQIPWDRKQTEAAVALLRSKVEVQRGSTVQ